MAVLAVPRPCPNRAAVQLPTPASYPFTPDFRGDWVAC